MEHEWCLRDPLGTPLKGQELRSESRGFVEASGMRMRHTECAVRAAWRANLKPSLTAYAVQSSLDSRTVVKWPVRERRNILSNLNSCLVTRWYAPQRRGVQTFSPFLQLHALIQKQVQRLLRLYCYGIYLLWSGSSWRTSCNRKLFVRLKVSLKAAADLVSISSASTSISTIPADPEIPVHFLIRKHVINSTLKINNKSQRLSINLISIRGAAEYAFYQSRKVL